MSYYKKYIITLCLLIAVIVVSYLAKTEAISIALSKSHLTLAQALNPSYRVGTVRTFVLDSKWQDRKVISARLVAKGEHADIWVDTGQQISRVSVSRLLARFDKQIYLRNIEYFATPPVRDRVDRVSILITDLGTLDGYFDSGDITGQNRLNLVYINKDVVKNEPTEAYNTLAHEFAHLLYCLGGGANIEWLDEGLAVYAEYINGGNPDYYVNSFLQKPDVALVKSASNKNSFYGSAFLFIASAAEQVEESGNSVPAFTRHLVENSSSGIRGINAVLHQFVSDPQLDSFNEIYRSHQLINYANKFSLRS